MRKATALELENLITWEVTVAFKVNGKVKRHTQIVSGYSKEIAGKQALQEVQKRFSQHGSDFEVESFEDLFKENEKFFRWDWKVLPSEDFFEKLDRQLNKFNSEVVEIPFDGDSYLWFVGPKIES